MPTASTARSAPNPPREVLDTGHDVLRAGIDCVRGPQIAGQLQFVGHHIHGDDFAAARQPQSLNNEQPDHPGADHHGRVVQHRRRAPHGVEGYRNRLDHRGVLKGQTLRQTVEDALGHGDVLSESPLRR